MTTQTTLTVGDIIEIFAAYLSEYGDIKPACLMMSSVYSLTPKEIENALGFNPFEQEDHELDRMAY